MIEASVVVQIVNSLKQDPENNHCFECSIEDPNFISINNGCLICTNCLESYSQLGPEISRIKTLSDSWAEDELKLLISGGNSALKDFFNHYNLTSSPPNFKFFTKSAFFYREMLSFVALGQEYELRCPSVEEGTRLMGTESLEGPIPEQPRVAPIVEEEGKSTWQWIKRNYNAGIEIGNNAVNKISKRIDQMSDKPMVKKVEEKTIHYADKFTNGVNHIFNKVSNKLTDYGFSPLILRPDPYAFLSSYNFSSINSSTSAAKIKVDTMNLFKQSLSVPNT